MNVPRRVLALAAALLAVAGGGLGSGLAAEPPGSGDDEDEWGEEEDDWGEGAGAGDFGADFGDDVKIEAERACPWVLTGGLRSTWAAWTERAASDLWASGKQSVDLAFGYRCAPWRVYVSGHGEWDAAYTAQRDDFDGPTLDAYEFLFDVRETFVLVTMGAVDVTFGRQTMTWGRAELLPVLEVGPRDLRDPGLTDVEVLRLPTLTTRIGLNEGAHRLELAVVHESFFGYRSPPFGPFSPFGALLPREAPAGGPSLVGREAEITDVQDRFDIDNQQVFLSWAVHGHGLDVALYGASVLDQFGVSTLPSPAEILGEGRLRFPLDHRRHWLVGASVAVPADPFVFEADVAVSLGRAFQTIEGDAGSTLLLGRRELDVVELMGSVTATPKAQTIVSLEVSALVPMESYAPLLFHLDAPKIGLRITQMALNDDLRIDVVGIVQLNAAGMVYRIGTAEVTWRVRDGLRISLGYVSLQPSDQQLSVLAGMYDHDRVFTKLRWDFTL